MSSILLVDDDHDMSAQLKADLGNFLGADSDIRIEIWEPSQKDGIDSKGKFESLLDELNVGLVVTDFDLTKQGMSGLFGATIVDWCQQNLVPVAEFSRMLEKKLPEEPNLFEMRIDLVSPAKQIASIYSGFKQVNEKLAGARTGAEFKSFRSPAAALATILNRVNEESLFALYATRYVGANSGLLDRIKKTLSKEIVPDEDEKNSVLAYICGHLLLNAVLRFPGPIMHREALGAYCGVDPASGTEIESIFDSCKYDGPFQDMGPFFWLDKIQNLIQIEAKRFEISAEYETEGEFNRIVVERILQRQLPRHACTRCQGQNGGFWCPLTRKTVCLRSSCSVASTSWVPRGAQLCRIEREFYEEWAPILGA
ncbi:MAG: hypothetical protein K2W84_05900 [Burkholderiales bacterium]|nr:hypothetical protein [Burkholderiales bacterium]